MERFVKSVFFGAAAIGVCLLAGCGKRDSATTNDLPTVRILTAQYKQADANARYSVSLLPYRQADLAFKSAGIVEQIRMVRGNDGQMRAVTMGDPISAGEMLARVRTTDYQQRVDQAQAQLQDLLARRDNARAAADLAEKNYTRATNLYHDQSLTKQDYDHAQQQRDSAVAQLQQAEAGIAGAKAQLAQAQLALSDTVVSSPFPGVVIARRVELGNLAGNTLPAFTVADISSVKADFTVPDTALPLIKLGREMTIRLTHEQKDVHAHITALSAAADPQSRVFTVELTAANPKGELKPGMIGSVELPSSAESQSSIVVPLTALVQSKTDGGFALFVVESGDATKVHQRAVSIGSSVGSDVQVLNGVRAGERIVIVGAQTLHDNDKVRVLE